MKLGKAALLGIGGLGLAGALSGGGLGGGNLAQLSPLLALFLAMKKKKGATDDSGAGPAVPTPAAVQVTQNPMLRAMGVQMPPQAQMPPGSFPIPFGPGANNPYGYGRY